MTIKLNFSTYLCALDLQLLYIIPMAHF